MENFNTNLKNLSKNKIHLILIGLAVIIFATVLIYAYVEYSETKINVIPLIPTEEGKPYCGAIGSRSEGWYIDSGFNRPELIRWDPELIRWDKCKGCVAICKAIGSRSEGWYSSCDGKLIKYDNCGEGQEEGNLLPVIDGLTAPTQVKVNENNVWTIKARDPENGALSYSVNWGDEYAKIALPESAPAELDTRSQTTTFTHSYNKIGTYTIKFIVTDDHRQTAEVSTTIKVVSKILEATCTDSDGGINKYVKGKTCRELHYSSSAAVSCKTDMCDGLCYSQSTSTNLEEKKDNVIPSTTPPSNSEAPFVKEYYCENDKIMSKHIHCENGCKDGACIKEKQTCDAKCKSLNYKSGICRGWTVVPPKENWGCKENEKDIGETSDCYRFKDVLGNSLRGIDKTCCCKIECHKELNKEDCELVGGEYKSACNSFGCGYWCECPCKTDSDCGADRCGQGRDICYELRYKCENGKCEHTKKEYKGYSCARYYDPASATPEKCLDTCGDGVCKSPETKWWCPEDCKEETKPITVISPNGGERLVEGGGTYKITWELNEPAISSNDKVGIYLVDYSRDGTECSSQGCEPWKRAIAWDLPAYPSEHLWSTSAPFWGAGLPPFLEEQYELMQDKSMKLGDKYKIRIGEIINGQGDIGDYDESDDYFSIIKLGDVSCRDENYPCSIEGIPCCSGLKSSALYGDPNGDCSTMANCGTICIPCGNGVCDANEGICNCPEDCKEEVVYDLDEYYLNIDYSCNTDSDCVIKDVHNCCGYYPKCVNKDAKVDPDYVRKACAVEGIASVCGYSSIDSCKCVQNKCEGFLKEEEKLSADLNCDEKVNLVDMAILLSWWSKDSSDQNSNVNQDGIVEVEICSPCKNPDINQDGKVNLVDFSIMMSQWTK